MDYDSIAKAGSMLGSGAVIVMDETRCMVRSLLRLSYFYFEESCGQCTPCREGTGSCYRAWSIALNTEKGARKTLDLLNNVAENIMGRTICADSAMPRRCRSAACSSTTGKSSSITSNTSSAWFRPTFKRGKEHG
ncbi:NADH-ubiquinone oxidoreductase-F iron-sulfur binding region domain-containing protein [Cupriavidus basilensis]